MIIVILFCIATFCFALAAAGVSSRVNLVASGLMFMALAFALNAGLLVWQTKARASAKLAWSDTT